jgi:autotransporter-associated beta strand protein
VFWPANLRVSGNFMPQIDSNSVGGISLYGSVSNGRWGENKGKVHLWAGTWGGGTGYAGPITPGPDGIYRVGSQPGDGALGLGSGANTFGGLYGTNAVEVGVPYCLELNGALLTGVGNFQGACEWNCSNTFSGPITVHQGGQLTGWTQNGGGSPFGATNGTVTLNGGLMQALAGISAERTLRKGAISIQGGCILIAGDRGYTNLVCSTLAFDSLTRLNHGGVLIQPLGSTAYSSLGAANRVKLVNEAPGLTNGIVAPWMLGANAFLSYDSATGFTNAPWTVDVTGTNFPTLSGGTDIVRVATAATLQDDPDLYALAVSNCAVSANAANDTITVRSGGLLLCGTACQVNANLVLGTAEAPVEGIVHNQINNNENNNQQPRLLGQITAAGLTKFGEGDVMLGGNNIGTLQGPIVVNQGYLVATNSVAFGSTSNWIVLNGGGISAVKDLAGKHLAVTNAIKIGPLGGLLHSGYDSPGTYIYGPISDWIDGDAGPLRICNNAVRLYGTNTYSGGTIFRCNAQFNGLCSLGTGPVRIDNGFKLSLFTFPARTVFGGRLSLNGAEAVLGIWQNPVSAGSLDGNGQVWLGEQYTTPTDLTLVIGTDNTDADFYGTIWDIPARCGNVVKTGTGNQTLWGDLTHHGATIISNGTLTVNGWIEFASSVVVKSGATLTGKGTISAPVMVEGSGRITGTLRIETNVTLGASVDFDLPLANGNSAGLTVKGISLGGAALNVMLGYAPAGGQTWTVVNNASGNPVSGQFACGAVASATYGGRTYYFRVNYAGGDGNDVTLTVIPRADGFFVW